MDLYYGRMSGNSARAVFGLTEAGAQFRPRLVDTRGGENRGAAYLTLNPMGKIPAFADGELKLWESNAINWYVAEKLGRLLPGSRGPRAGAALALLPGGARHAACVPLFRFTNARVQAFWQTKGDAQSAEAARKELARYLPVLEAGSQGREWLETDFSLADVAYAPHLQMIAEGGFDFSPYPRVKQWLGRLSARPAWRKTAELVFAE